MRNTLTVDNGKEFSARKSLAQTLEIDTCFAHAYHKRPRKVLDCLTPYEVFHPEIRTSNKNGPNIQFIN
jgi:IS30 family transposase